MPLSVKRLNRALSNHEVRTRPTPKISMPVVLQSSTNLHLNELLDLKSAREMMAARATVDSRTTTPSSSVEPELTDGSSAGSSPTIEYNHLSAYFPGPAAAVAKAADASAPMVPQRVPSHSKRQHERLARQRSLRGVGRTSPVSPSSPTFPQDIQRTSLEMMGVNTPEPPLKTTGTAKRRSPRPDDTTFSPQLEKLAEAVEEQMQTAVSLVEDEDAVHMRQHGLIKLDASTYCNSIGSPFDLGFQATWI